ncbi:hypothetical protein [Paenibacillus phytorum]|nr:hypothetical protein [Paenibacillus phytorum]
MDNYYYEKGWHILRIWEHLVKGDFETTNQGMVQFIDQTKEKQKPLRD